ncbi:MAG: aldo/keto reductase, partial [Candidatus Eremiobacteraeota bacterium]|nr:aldo/keto reductase [Candidatus Eremiobacteraeota bacterium]
WQVMKALATSDRYGWSRFAAYQGYYSLVGRDYEWELMPLGLDQGVGLMVWSPLGWARLTGKIRRGQPMEKGRIQSGGDVGGPQVEDEYLYSVVDVLTEIAEETGKTIPQVALNWLLTRPTVANLVVGARNEKQLRANLDAVGWSMSAEQLERLDQVSRRHPAYPYWHQMGYDSICPKPVPWG